MSFNRYTHTLGRAMLATATLTMISGVAATAQALFPEIDTSFAGQTVVIPEQAFDYTVLFRQDESMVKNSSGVSALARGNHDYTAYVPINGSSTHGWLLINHELRDSNTAFGDGGGMTVFEAKEVDGAWTVVGDYRSIDFSTVGGTYNNCGGAQTPYGTVLTAEEADPASNAEIYNSGKNVRDTSDVTVEYDGQTYTIPRYMNIGWLVEVDPVSGEAVRKHWKMGRLSHEGGYCTPDGTTVYITDDNSPAVLFKFVAETPNDYTEGQLYAYKQSEDGETGEWMPMPMAFDSLLVIRDVAIRRGATLFIRHEWVTEANGKIYITETGLDNFDWGAAVAMGGVPATYYDRLRISSTDYEYEDLYGRIAELDPESGKIRSWLEGGTASTDPSRNLSNPDGLETMTIDGTDWLIINEDLNGRSANRVSPDAEAAGRTIGEIYLINPADPNPTVDKLKRLLIGPTGAETTGGKATPDGTTYFVNIQHPSGSNPPPFNKSATLAITGFGDYVSEETFDLFPPLDTSFAGQTVIIPDDTEYAFTVLFRQDESVVTTADGASGLARGNHDFTGYIPIDGSNQHGWLLINHELRDSNSTFGDGGGMTVFEAKVVDGEWKAVGDYRNVDFSGVGGTYNNCGGAQTPYGTVLTAEEFAPSSNVELYNSGKGTRDTSDLDIEYDGETYTIPRYKNVGWMVEVDPVSGAAVRKHWKMGRMSHEGGYCMPDGKTVYITDDSSPAILFKFEAEVANDYTEGQLYAYKQSDDGLSGAWLIMPMEFDSLLVVRDVAMRMGATLFIRHEWVTEANGKLYITETGLDQFNWDAAVAKGGVPARHFESLRTSGEAHDYEDLYGRVLELDPATEMIRPYLEGGTSTWDPSTNFSNPDGLVTMTIDGKEWLVINEDLNGRSGNRVSADAEAAGRTVCEVYVLDPAIANPTVDDLKRLVIGPNGAETTGGRPTPDGSTYFLNIQHPSGSNPPPFNKSATLAMTGFDDFSSSVRTSHGDPKGTFRLYPNPTTGRVLFNTRCDVALYNTEGVLLRTERDVRQIDLSSLTKGVYFVQTTNGEVARIVVE